MVCTKRVDSIFENPDEDQVKNSKNEIGEDDGRMQHAEDLLAQWIDYQAHMPKNYERNMLRSFLRGAKHDLEKAKRKLEAHFIARYAYPDFFSGRNPYDQELNRVFDTVDMVFLPKLTENGDRISVFSIADSDATKFDIASIAKVFLMIYDLIMTRDSPISGEVVIFDLRNLTSSHMAKVISTPFKNLMILLKDAYAVRIKQIHILFAPSVFDTILMAIKPFLHEKVKKRFLIHKDLSSLAKQVAPSLLPKEYGGELESLRKHSEKWREIICENSDWFREQENIKIVGKPPKQFQQFQTHIGMEGSFRKLSID